MRRGILDFYFGNKQNRLGKEQNSFVISFPPSSLLMCSIRIIKKKGF